MGKQPLRNQGVSGSIGPRQALLAAYDRQCIGETTQSHATQSQKSLHDFWQAETREEVYKAFDDCIERFSPKYPGAVI